MSDARLHDPATGRNFEPILRVLRQHLKGGRLLEIAAGTGQHAARLAAEFPLVDWQPSDLDAGRFASIAAWGAFARATNLRAPVVLDAGKPGWAADWAGLDAVLVVNLLHLIAAPAAEAVLLEARQALAPGGAMFVYGPFLRDGVATSEGDAAFDARLRAQDPATGYKDVSWVRDRLGGLTVTQYDMPANNLMFVARKS